MQQARPPQVTFRWPGSLSFNAARDKLHTRAIESGTRLGTREMCFRADGERYCKPYTTAAVTRDLGFVVAADGTWFMLDCLIPSTADHTRGRLVGHVSFQPHDVVLETDGGQQRYVLVSFHVVVSERVRACSDGQFYQTQGCVIQFRRAPGEDAHRYVYQDEMTPVRWECNWAAVRGFVGVTLLPLVQQLLQKLGSRGDRNGPLTLERYQGLNTQQLQERVNHRYVGFTTNDPAVMRWLATLESVLQGSDILRRGTNVQTALMAFKDYQLALPFARVAPNWPGMLGAVLEVWQTTPPHGEFTQTSPVATDRRYVSQPFQDIGVPLHIPDEWGDEGRFVGAGLFRARVVHLEASNDLLQRLAAMVPPDHRYSVLHNRTGALRGLTALVGAPEVQTSCTSVARRNRV